jgi:hypothetical protein
MDLFRGHLVAASIVGVAFASIGAAFAFARPTGHASVPGRINGHLPYRLVSYTAADARRAFAAEGIHLRTRSHSPTITTLGNRHDILEVDAFGDRAKVEQSGFRDFTLVKGRFVHFPRDCRSGSPDAERWHGNVRVIVSCTAAGTSSSLWLRRAQRALARL